MTDRYNPEEAEPKWRKFWEEKDIYKFKIGESIVSIDTPPPTVSGKMHMGHALAYAQTDFIARYQRMRGKAVFYPFGFDDNGLATERFVEKKRKIKGSSMSRSEFIKLCLEETKETEEQLQQHWASLGLACDWSLVYRTIDDASRKISQRSFVDLYNQGREYRKQAPVMWCPTCQTAIAQVEAKDKEKASTFNYIKAEVENETVVFATTRPEMMPACVAMSVHPDDKRYQHLVGKEATLPLFKRKVPIVADVKTDPDKGTGVVYWCTYGGIDDVEWILEHHKIEPVHVMKKDGTFNELAGKYEGMKTLEARKQIVADLQAAGAIDKIEEITHAVNVHERCETDVEYISTKQWFIKYLDLKEKFLELGSELNWYPEHMKVRYDNWVKGLKWDWCISRQRFFGVPIPVWYCKKCERELVAAVEDLPVDPTTDSPKRTCECGSDEFTPEKDILDTWATSSLTSEIALGWPSERYEKLAPMTLRPNGHDIITFWLFNTVAKSYLHHKRLPWRDCMINGFVLDPKGKKMSKSKGNVIDPLETMKKFGADPLRFWAASSKLGDDIPFQEKELVAGKKLMTKLANAVKFVFMHVQEKPGEKPTLEMVDRYILSRLGDVIDASTNSFEKYEFSKTKALVENFFWHEWCDYYLEIVKRRLYDEQGLKLAARYTLYTGSLAIMKLLAPIMPHITEELYQTYYAKYEDESIHVTRWPEPFPRDMEAIKLGEVLFGIIGEVRREKAAHKLSLKSPVKELSVQVKLAPTKWGDIHKDVEAATHAEEIKFRALPDAAEKSLVVETKF